MKFSHSHLPLVDLRQLQYDIQKLKDTNKCVGFGGEIFAPDLYEGSFLTEAFLFIVGGVVLEALDRMVFSLAGIHRQLKKLNGSENNEVQEPTVTKKKFNMGWDA